MNGVSLFRALGIALATFFAPAALSAQDTIDHPATAPAAGPSASRAVGTVYRILDQKRGVLSTGFQSMNGWIITTYSAVGTTETSQIAILGSGNTLGPATRVLRDVSLGLAAIKIEGSMSLDPPLTIRAVPTGTPSSAILNWLPVGTPVSIWGRPTAYRSNWPLLYSGTVAGAEGVTTEMSFSNQILLFGAFDPGMNGSPVVDTSAGDVVGVLTAEPGGISANDSAWYKRVITALGNQPVTTPAPDGGPPVNHEVAVSRSLLDLSNQVHPILTRAIPATDLAVFVSRLPANP